MAYEALVILVCICGVFSYINVRFLKLPPTIGVMLLSLVLSLLVLAAGSSFPWFSNFIVTLIGGIDFGKLLMKVMLGFLLFAGAIHIDATALRKQMLSVIALSTIGTVLSTAIIAVSLFYMLPLFHLQIPLIYCLLFAALISPTDPVAVLAILKKAKLPQSLELKIAGESLFNDGVAVVIFVSLLEISQIGYDKLSAGTIALSFLREAGGGLLYGAFLGYLGYWAIRTIDNYQVEVLITIGTVMGGYFIADLIHVSGPLAMVVAGIILGNKARKSGMSDISMDYTGKFWELMDEILNAILFLLVGFEMLVIKMDGPLLLAGCAVIVIALLARWLSVALPISILSLGMKFEKNVIGILTWGGLRGGLSIALALSLPQNAWHDPLLAITYIVVVFSIAVQGFSLIKFSHKLL